VVREGRDRVIAGIVTAVPILSLLFVGRQLWASLLGWNDIFVFLLLYVLTGLGVTVGVFTACLRTALSRPPARSARL
jgi:hypothetical protein